MATATAGPEAAARLRGQQRSVDVRLLPDPATMAATIAALPSHQPASRMYQVMTAVAYYAGLRPSEVVMLRPRALHLPTSGLGSHRRDRGRHRLGRARRAEDRSAARADPTASRRDARVSGSTPATSPSDDLIFRTRNDRRPTPSNWSRAWQRALRDRRAADRCVSTTAATPPPPRGSALACRSGDVAKRTGPQRRDARVHLRRRPRRRREDRQRTDRAAD